MVGKAVGRICVGKAEQNEVVRGWDKMLPCSSFNNPTYFLSAAESQSCPADRPSPVGNQNRITAYPWAVPCSPRPISR